jgi:hypothetical protein
MLYGQIFEFRDWTAALLEPLHRPQPVLDAILTFSMEYMSQ